MTAEIKAGDTEAQRADLTRCVSISLVFSGSNFAPATIYAEAIRSRTGTTHDIEHLAAAVAAADTSTREKQVQKARQEETGLARYGERTQACTARGGRPMGAAVWVAVRSGIQAQRAGQGKAGTASRKFA